MPEPITPASLFKCLADETRTRISLLIAREGELCVCELTAALEQSQPKISRHLAQLRASGLLDRVDALCFAAPVFFHSVRWTFDL